MSFDEPFFDPWAFFSYCPISSLLMPYNIHITHLFPQLVINEDTFFLNVVACLKVQRENSYLKLLQHPSQNK